MIKIASPDAVRAIEVAANEAGFPFELMMEHAGTAVAKRAIALINQLPQPDQARVTVLVGATNNGADGLVAARVIAQNSAAQVRIYLLKPRADDDPHMAAVREIGLFIADATADQRYRVLTNMIASAHIVIDAISGIGTLPPLREEAAKLLKAANAALGVGDETENIEGDILIPSDPTSRVPDPPRPYILAVDCPSGLNCDTGEIDKHALTADETVTFIAVKPGLLTFPGAAYVGSLTFASIGIPENTPGFKEQKRFLVDSAYVREKLPARNSNSHKGSYGKALVVGGSVNYTGAAGLAATAAYRSGVGLVTVGAPAPVAAALSGRVLEPTWLLLPHDMGVLAGDAAPILHKEANAYNAMLIGCGINREKVTRDMLITLFKRDSKSAKRAIGFMSAKQTAQSETETEYKLPPLVLDADALNLLSEIDSWWTLLPPNTVITPHAGEMGRLAKLEREVVEHNRWQIAAEKSAEWNCIVLLKGAHTLIAAPDGRVAVLPFKTSALSTAGTGDILAGLITGLIAQGMPSFEATACGAYIHGASGLAAAKTVGGERAVIAGDVLDHISSTLRQIEG